MSPLPRCKALNFFLFVCVWAHQYSSACLRRCGPQRWVGFGMRRSCEADVNVSHLNFCGVHFTHLVCRGGMASPLAEPRSPGGSFLSATQSPSWFNADGNATFFRADEAREAEMRASARARRLSTSKSSPVIGPHGLDQTPKKPPPRPTTACDDINDASPYR